jgi:hypothetical protein
MFGRWLRVACLLLVAAPVTVGCTGRSEKGRNQDLDRPRSADTRR